MFEIKMGQIQSPMIKTSDFGGLPLEDLAELCVDKIVGVSDSAPPAIREQAKYFRQQIQKTVLDYLKRAAQSERATCIQVCLQGGEEKAAHLLRRS
jgi:hypothetical protein